MTDVNDIREKSYIDDEGVLRWNSNDRVPFDDMLQVAVAAGIIFNIPASQKARNEGALAFVKEYKKGRANMSDEQHREEAVERRAAFGPGETVVDVLTGEKFRT